MNEYPTDYLSPHKKIKGTATVQASSDTDTFHEVNLTTGECDCAHGQAYRWSKTRWVSSSWCAHKMRALSSILEKKYDPELMAVYEKQLGRRHNAFVAVSAYHKELRRGDIQQALYWASVMFAHRGPHGLIRYMVNIIFEETRDLELLKYLLALSSRGTSVTRLDAQRATARFCIAPKKWDLPHRLPIFLDEQRGYRKLIKDYGIDVAKPKDIIPKKEHKKLVASLFSGFKNKDRVAVQYGLKGFFKAESDNHEEHKITLLNHLIDVYNEECDNAFDVDWEYTQRVYELVMRRVRQHGSPGYHELNALCDALTGESDDGTFTPDSAAHKNYTTRPKPYNVPLGDFRKIPLYAHDNHTWMGKAKMRKVGAVQLQPGADQVDIDFRLCGAYMGVAWRHLAVKQHGTIDCKWGEVAWNRPSWLWPHLDSMWY